MKMSKGIDRWVAAAALAVSLGLAPWSATAAYERTFEAGSLIIPMDLSYQDHGLLQAYGLVFQLLRHGIPVYWVIYEEKKWHAVPCDTAGDECAWDCWEEGSGIKCAYPTASPDFYASATVLWDGDGRVWDADSGASTADAISNHGYRGGPFVIDAAQADRAREIIDLWNDPDRWPAADQCPPAATPGESDCWARRSVFNTVTVHEATAAFQGEIRKRMVAAPTIAVFSDGNEDIATGYLRAAGIHQSNGQEFPAAKCGACGPGTDNPDMLTVEAIMGEMGTCTDQNYDHKNGALFTADGVPAYCQIMSMHWGVNDRNTVTCDGDNNLTYHGHEVVAEVRQFLNYPTHFFAECQAVNAYENTVPDPEAPFLDDTDRVGHFLTTIGTPPSCDADNPCTGADTQVSCGAGGCDDGARDCCLPDDNKELGAGFLIGEQPDTADVKVLSPAIPYNQLDGWFGTTGGSEKSYNLSTFLGTEYKNDMDITFLTGPDGPGQDDIWMTGYLDGTCAIHAEGAGQCQGVGKVSYLGGHEYKTDLPVSENWQTQGTRMFLNALFEADCVTTVGQPSFVLELSGETEIATQTLPVTETYTVSYENLGIGAALESVLVLTPPAGAAVDDQQAGGAIVSGDLEWEIGSIGSWLAMAGDPDNAGSRWAALTFDAEGQYPMQARMRYRVGVSVLTSPAVQVTVRVVIDSDGDGVGDADDPAPDDARQCGDSDNDDCDDCSVSGHLDPANDGRDSDGDGLCDTGDPRPDDPRRCGDSDNDTCDDCAVTGKRDPANDGEDSDGDGLCDAGDPDPYNAGPPDAGDPGPGGGIDGGVDIDGGPALSADGSLAGNSDGGSRQEEEDDGSGCQCNAVGASSSGSGLLLVFSVLLLVAARPRRRSVSRRR